MTELSPADLAYAAALVDTMATFTTRTAHETELPVLTIQSTRHDAAVRFLCKLTGQKPIEIIKQYSKHICMEHCPDAHADIDSSSLRWQVVGVKATIVLSNLLPYLREKKTEARQFITMGQTIGYKGQVVNQMKDHGWDIPELKPQPRRRVELTG